MGAENRGHDALVLHKDDSENVSLAAGASVELIISHSQAAVAGAVAALGPSAVVLLLFGGLRGVAEPRRWDYEAYPEHSAGRAAPDCCASSELEERFGLWGPGTLAAEARRGAASLEQRIDGLDDAALAREVAELRTWRVAAGGRLRALERRVAWSLLGLEQGSAGPAEVRRAFKRRALALHPDKGGDAERFQLLQEMKELLVQRRSRGSRSEAAGKRDEAAADGEDESSDDEPAPNKSAAEGGEDGGSAEGAAATVGAAADRGQLERDRKKLQQDLAELWCRCQRLAGELGDASSARASAAREGGALAAQRLRALAERVVPVELALLKEGDPDGALGALDRILQDGGEVLAAASIMDPATAVSIVATQVTGPLTARAPSPELRRRCAALLEAIRRAPELLEEQLAACGDSAAAVDGNPLRSDHDRAGDGASPVEEGEGSDARPRAEAPLGRPVREPAAPDGDGDESCLLAEVKPARRTGWEAADRHECAGPRRSDGSAVYCTACDCWVSLDSAFEFGCFLQHCEADFMHGMAVGSLA